MDHPTHVSDAFAHVRLILGFVVSLSLARLLSGLARYVQHPSLYKPDFLHIAWAFATLLLIVHFWWWEFWLAAIPTWNFSIYAFLLCFVFSLYLQTTLLFPDDVEEYKGYGDYFMARRAWFFGLFILINAFDIVDTLIKGEEHYSHYGIGYWIQDPIYIVLAAIAIATPDRRFQIAFVVFNIVVQFAFIAQAFNVLG